MIKLENLLTEKEHNILIIDEDKKKISEIKKALVIDKVNIKSYETTKEALEKIGENFYDVVIFHYHNLKDNGIDFLRYFKEQSPNSSFIATTSRYDENLEIALLNEGVYTVHNRNKIKPARLQAIVRNIFNLTETYIDDKTGFYTSTILSKRIEEELRSIFGRRKDIDKAFKQRRKGAAPYFSVILMDIDNFKEINDTYGHIEGGDLVLKRIAEEIKSNTRPTDIRGRYGGDELVVALSGANYDKTMDGAETLREKIENLGIKSTDGKIIPATVTMGVATIPEIGIENRIRGILHAADMALLYGKQKKGGNCVVGYRDL